MVNKRSLWFLTLFSLILVLSVYYITMPSELLMTTNNIKNEEVKEVSGEENSESAELVALRVESEEEMLDKINELKEVITNKKSSNEEKNKAFDTMQKINQNRGKEEEVQNKIKNEQKLNSFVKIENNDVTVVIDSTKHDKSLANKIMRTVQSCFDNKMSISVRFQK